MASRSRGDPQLVAEGRELDDVLQLAGDALVGEPGSPLAREWAERLRRRDLEGDAELADALSGEAGKPAGPLAVDYTGQRSRRSRRR